MILDNIKVGLEIKSYKALCELLGEKTKTGNSKKAQIKEFERHFKYHKDGNKFIIDEIYEESLDKIDGRRDGNNNIYNNLAQLIIVDMLLRKKEKNISVSKRKLIEFMGMVNENYNGLKDNTYKLSQYAEMDVRFVYEFYNVNESNFNNIIDTALKKLEDKRIIMYQKVYKVKIRDNDKTRVANAGELNLIANIEKIVLKEFGFNSVSDIRKTSKWKDYKSSCKQLISNNSDIEYYYQAYDISINKDFLDEEKELLLNEISKYSNRMAMKKELNDIVKDKIIHNATKRRDNSMITFKNWEVRTSKDYISNTEKLNGILINLNTPNIIQNVLEYKSNTRYVTDSELPF